MKVLHLINNLKREGAQIVIYNLVVSSDIEKVQPVVCAREPGGELQAELKQHDIPVYVPEKYYGAFQTGRSLQYIAKVIDKESIDIIHAHMADAAFLGWLAARKHGLPLVITHHGHDVLPVCHMFCRFVYYFCLSAAARYAKKNVVVSSSVANSVHRKLFTNSDNIKIIANGVPVPAEETKARINEPGCSKFNIVIVGRLFDIKGHEQLISAVEMLVGDYPGLRCYIVGDGPLRDQLQQRVYSLGLSANIIFTGSVPDVSVYLRKADVYVSTSHYEGMPLSILEAMSWSVPVIASNVPGNRDVVEHDKNGLIYQLGDINALVSLIRHVINNPDLAQERARQAYQSVVKCYSIKASCKDYESIYGDILISHKV